jgi:hypothetical protein
MAFGNWRRLGMERALERVERSFYSGEEAAGPVKQY